LGGPTRTLVLMRKPELTVARQILNKIPGQEFVNLPK
jgi:hypothetical protein